MSLTDWKDLFEILGFFSAFLYFVYQLLAGSYILNRLTVELSCDIPFADKALVRSVVKLTNPGIATLGIQDAKLWVFKLRTDGQPDDSWKEPKSAYPLDQTYRVAFAEPVREWFSLDPGSTNQRQFLRRLEPGLYKFEFRIVTAPNLGAVCNC